MHDNKLTCAIGTGGTACNIERLLNNDICACNWIHNVTLATKTVISEDFKCRRSGEYTLEMKIHNAKHWKKNIIIGQRVVSQKSLLLSWLNTHIIDEHTSISKTKPT